WQRWRDEASGPPGLGWKGCGALRYTAPSSIRSSAEACACCRPAPAPGPRPCEPAYGRAKYRQEFTHPMARTTELPEHVRRIVDEIEREIGEPPGLQVAQLEGVVSHG